MTPGIGLNTWKRIGSLNRELRPYIEYVRRGWNVKILTFDRGLIPELPEGIEAVRFPHSRLLWLLPWIHKELGSWTDVIKTNQSNNAYFYTKAAKSWKKPILLRCGYVQGEYLETTIGLTQKVRCYQWLEAKAFQGATHCQIPTEELSEWVQRKYTIEKEKITVAPNFVDTCIFKPIPGIQRREKFVISVGRLDPVKRFDLLIKACAEIPRCTLTIVGEGSERHYLANLARELNLNLNLPGNVPNEELPGILQAHQIFALTSKWEGHPKALSEAMACGMPCLAAKAAGVENLIQHGTNGWLVEPTIHSLQKSLQLLLFDRSLSERLSIAAQQFAVTNYSFEDIMRKEIEICNALSNLELC